jgi:hypothetical protein
MIIAMARLVDFREFIWTSLLRLKKASFLSSYTPRLIHVYALVERVGVERVGQETKLVASASLSQMLPSACSYTRR